jgi:hypothetical protein
MWCTTGFLALFEISAAIATLEHMKFIHRGSGNWPWKPAMDNGNKNDDT